MKHLFALIRMGRPHCQPADWVYVQRWLAAMVTKGRLVVRYESGILADVVSLASITPDDLAGAVIEVYDARLTWVFHRP